MKKYECFLKVIEYGSFTEAAKSLNYTQPAVSHMINTLEKDLHLQLFVRSRHGLQLTYEGAQILPYIQNLVNAQKSLETRSLSLRDSQSGVIKIATFGSFIKSLIPNILHRFREEYPKIIFEFHQGYYREIENWINKDSCDFGVTSLNQISGNLETIPLFNDPFFLAVPKGHKLSLKKTITLSDLANHNLINSFVALDDGEERSLINQLKGNDIPQVQYQFCEYDGILSSVELGLGVAIVPKLALLGSHRDLVYIPFDPSEERTIGIAYKPSISKIASPLISNFITCIQKETQGFSSIFF